MTTEEFIELIQSTADSYCRELEKAEWVEACEELAIWFEVSAQAAREELGEDE